MEDSSDNSSGYDYFSKSNDTNGLRINISRNEEDAIMEDCNSQTNSFENDCDNKR